MWTALFFSLGLHEVTHDLGYGKGPIEKGQRYIISLRLFFYADNSLESTFDNPDPS